MDDDDMMDVDDEDGELSADSMEEMPPVALPGWGSVTITAEHKMHQTLLLVQESSTNDYYVERRGRLVESLNNADTIKSDIRSYQNENELESMIKAAREIGYNQIIVSYTP